MAEKRPPRQGQATQGRVSTFRNASLEIPSYLAATRFVLISFTATSCKVTFNCFSSTTTGNPPPPFGAAATGATYCGCGCGNDWNFWLPSPYRLPIPDRGSIP